MSNRVFALVVLSVTMSLLSCAARADKEANNRALVVTDKSGRCSARSTPKYDFDPFDEPRQQGVTTTYYVTKHGDIHYDTYDWFSGTIFISCSIGGNETKSSGGTTRPTIYLVRLGPWHRFHPQEDHLAIAFYADGKLLNSYSTLEIAGDGKPPRKCNDWQYENMSHSISHYTVFGGQRDPGFGTVRIKTRTGSQRMASFEIITVDGRKLTFRLDTGEWVGSKKTARPEPWGVVEPC